MSLPAAVLTDIGALELGMLLGAYLAGDLLLGLLRRITFLGCNMVDFSLILSSFARDIITFLSLYISTNLIKTLDVGLQSHHFN